MSELLEKIGFPQVQRYRQKAVYSQKVVALQSLPEQIWPYLTNSNWINRKVGAGEVFYRFMPLPKGGTELLATTRLMGLSAQYYELPFYWQWHRFGGVERFFTSGPLRYFGFRFEVEPGETGSRVKLQMGFHGGLFNKLAGPLGRIMIGRFAKVLLQMDQAAQSESGSLRFEALLEDPQAHRQEIQTLTEAWGNLASDPKIPAKAAEWIYRLPEENLAKIRPFEMAEYFGLDPLGVLEFFLAATQKGWLNLQWDILCPRCRGAKGSAGDLKDLNQGYHCESCRIDYNTGLDENVEVTFSPAAKVRKYSEAIYCFGGPANTPHILIQTNLDPGGQQSLEVSLPSGDYHLLTQESAKPQPLAWEKTDGPPVQIDWDLTNPTPDLLPRYQGRSLVFRLANSGPDFLTFKLDQREWYKNAAKASFVLNLQDFRDLFSSQVLRPGVNLGIASMVILFTDLKDSTRMYDKKGDSTAFAVVQGHFDILTEVLRRHHGGMVKTIGDAIMAGFNEPVNALAAAFEFLERFQKWNEEHPDQEPIVLKIGFHQGPCIALNLNDRLDYFGGTVNKAARIQGLSEGGDLVFTKSILEDREVEKFLTQKKAELPRMKIEEFTAELKGLSSSIPVLRVVV